MRIFNIFSQPEEYIIEIFQGNQCVTKEKTIAPPEIMQDQFMQMLEYFGQSPIIVRSSSLLEDNFGNAFAGKYESVFCVNQGPPKQRLEEFVNAIKIVSLSNADAYMSPSMDLDLCPECMSELIKFLTDKKGRGKI